MNNRITYIDKFDSGIVDHDIIVPNKYYFNVYNNSLDEPFHKFWFFIENAKLTNIYNENSIFRFALNNKSEKNKILIDYLKKLFSHIKSLFEKMYPEIEVEIPWKENVNYPYLINFFANNSTICLDSEKNTKNIVEINKEQICSILFELTYIQIIKIVSGDNISHSLKFKFSLIMIQEKTFDIRACLLDNINQINNPKPNYGQGYHNPIPNPNSNPNLNLNPPPIHNSLMVGVLGELKSDLKPLKSIQTSSHLPAQKLLLDPSILLNKKNALNKIEVKEKENKDSEEGKNIPEYLEQKNKLKKVETDERTLIPILKKEYEDLALVNNPKIVNNKDKVISPNQMEEIEEVDEMGEELSNGSFSKSKNKPNTNTKKITIDVDLEAELEAELLNNLSTKNSKNNKNNSKNKTPESKSNNKVINELDLDLEFEKISSK
jgi:hypothetical protein